MAKRLTAAPGGSVISKRPSMARGSGFLKVKWSSVKASGSSTTAVASSAAIWRPVPSAEVRPMGAP